MEKLNLKPTSKTPRVILNKDENQFLISGKSLPEDVREFYNPVFEWFDSYFTEPNPVTTLIFEISYYNTASSKIFLDLLFFIKDAIDKGININIIWRYEQDDDEILEAGHDYERIVKIPIQIEEVDSIP
jgi:SiaC family regulatory phosphoprotein